MRFVLALLPLALCAAISACGQPFEAGSSGSGGGSSTGSGKPATEGCADGTREAFTDVATFPDIAGCAGGFRLPGIAASFDLKPGCNRQGGDDGKFPNGEGCSAVDLCASGWHVCDDAADVVKRSGGKGCDKAGGFWATRQSQSNLGGCAPPPASNNLVGCGDLGRAAEASCAPLPRVMRSDDCAKLGAWKCGDAKSVAIEGAVVTKTSPAEGGVVCCRD